MKNLLVPISFVALLLLGAGCQKPKQDSTLPVPPVVQELQTQAVPQGATRETRGDEPFKKPTAPPTLYRGNWFDVTYPSNFVPNPTAPTVTSQGLTFVSADEATFTSPDKTVEFFVYSPLWSGEPKSYLTIAPTETIVDDKTTETPIDPLKGGTKTRWVTVEAKDHSYYRSFVSIYRQIGIGGEVHHVFGIKYRDAAAYATYKESYTAFKASLRQYAD